MLSTYLGYRIYAQDLTKTLQRAGAEPAVARERSYYEANIGKVRSVDDLLKNYRLYSYAMKASGLDDMIDAKGFMKKVLQSDLTDPKSFVNELTDSRYKQFASIFNFSASGKVADTAVAQSADQEDDTIGLYKAKVGTVAAYVETQYYKAHIGAVKTIGDLLNDQRLYKFVTTAYGIDGATAKPSELTSVLESDASDQASFAAKAGISGSVAPSLHLQAQSTANQQDTVDLYAKQAGPSQAASIETAYYNKSITSKTSVKDVLADPRLVLYITQAYGLTGPTYTADVLRKVLTSDVSDPMSVARQLGAAATKLATAFNFAPQTGASPYVRLAQDFNFGPDGKIGTQRVAQSVADITSTEQLYTRQAGTSATAKADAKTETAYYQKTMRTVTTLDGFLGDPQLVAYATKAYGLGTAKLTNETLRKVLTSDLADPKSAANALGPAYRALSAAFQFTTTATIARDPAGQAQSIKDALTLGDGYDRYILESEAGDQNEGVRLALYFQRKAPAITSAYDILADKALLKVVQTALNIPATTSKLDIDAQARMITSRLKLADLNDPKKLDRFLARFSALYDANNGTRSSSSGLLSLFSTATS